MLRPSSAEGAVFRDKWVETFEPIYYAVGLAMAIATVAIGSGWMALVILLMLVLARWSMFAPHIVVTDTALVSVSPIGRRRFPYEGIKRVEWRRGLRVYTRDPRIVFPYAFRWATIGAIPSRERHGSAVADHVNRAMRAAATDAG